MRVSEAVALRLSDVGRPGLRSFGKESMERVVLIQDDLANEILSYAQEKELNQASFLFISRKGAHITRQRADQIMRAAGRRAHLPRTVHANLFRYGHAINFLNSGGGLEALQELLGPDNTINTRVYLRISADDPALER